MHCCDHLRSRGTTGNYGPSRTPRFLRELNWHCTRALGHGREGVGQLSWPACRRIVDCRSRCRVFATPHCRVVSSVTGLPVRWSACGPFTQPPPRARYRGWVPTFNKSLLAPWLPAARGLVATGRLARPLWRAAQALFRRGMKSHGLTVPRPFQRAWSWVRTPTLRKRP